MRILLLQHFYPGYTEAERIRDGCYTCLSLLYVKPEGVQDAAKCNKLLLSFICAAASGTYAQVYVE